MRLVSQLEDVLSYVLLALEEGKVNEAKRVLAGILKEIRDFDDRLIKIIVNGRDD